MSSLENGAGSARRHRSVAFLAGEVPAAAGLLYKLLCLHPEVAYISRLEHRLPWLPVSLGGRLRLRRYSSKLHWWFRDAEPRQGVSRSLVRLIAPVEGEGVYRHLGVGPAALGEALPERVVGRLRHRFARLQETSGSRLLVAHASASGCSVASLDVAFPEARFISVLCDQDRPPDAASGEAERIARDLRAIPPARVLPIRYEDLVEEPIGQMRQVLSFLGLERRLDYEWALKALNLGEPTRYRRPPANGGAARGAEPDPRDSLPPREYVS